MRSSLIIAFNLWLGFAQSKSTNVNVAKRQVEHPRSIISRYCTPDQTNRISSILSEVAQWCVHARAAADEGNVDETDHRIFRWLFLRERPSEPLREGLDITHIRRLVQRRFDQIHREALQSSHGQILISCNDNYDLCDETDPDVAFAHPVVSRNSIVLVGLRTMKMIAISSAEDKAD